MFRLLDTECWFKGCPRSWRTLHRPGEPVVILASGAVDVPHQMSDSKGPVVVTSWSPGQLSTRPATSGSADDLPFAPVDIFGFAAHLDAGQLAEGMQP